MTNAFSIDDETIPLPAPNDSFGSKKTPVENQTSSNLEKESKQTTEYINGGAKTWGIRNIDAGCDEVIDPNSPSVPDVYNTLEVELIHKEISSKPGLLHQQGRGRMNNSIENKQYANGENTFVLDQQYTFANLPAECSPVDSKNIQLDSVLSEHNQNNQVMPTDANENQLQLSDLKKKEEQEFLNSSIKISKPMNQNPSNKKGPLVGWQGQSCIKIFDWNTGEEIDRKKMS